MTIADKAIEKFSARRAVVGVLGLGYAGLPLVLAFAQAGFRTIGFDTDREKVEQLQRGRSYIDHLPADCMSDLIAAKKFSPTTDFGGLSACDMAIISVPTPLDDAQQPNLEHVTAATMEVLNYLHSGQLVVLSSTTYPGTTHEVILPILARRGLKVGEEFFLAFSPEREDPGNREYTIHNTPKLVGGVTPDCLAVAVSAFKAAFSGVIPVSSARVAEAAKLLENTYRFINIALINELKLAFEKMDIDVWEVVDAAATKPFGFSAFYPSPGAGGHCIPVAPMYLNWKAGQLGQRTRLIGLAGEINSAMPRHVVDRLAEGLGQCGKQLAGSRILILGVSYKANIEDVRESPAIAVIELLEAERALTHYHDPFVPRLRLRDRGPELSSVDLTDETLRSADAVVILAAHRAIDYAFVLRHANLVVDTRNATAGCRKPGDRVVMA